MERASAFITSVAGLAAIAVLSACAGSQSSPPGLLGSASTQSSAAMGLARSGGSPKFGGPIPMRGTIVLRQIAAAHHAADLFVSDDGSNAGVGSVDVLANKKWKYRTGITDGIDGPDGSFYAKGNFYVANYLGVNITEYSSSNALAYTYNSGMIDPIDVTVDSRGNVYEADYSSPGYVNEYRQQSNSVVATCSPGGGVEGVAVDKSGNVFADYNVDASGNGMIVEYRHGLSNCKSKVLPITLAFAGGMAIDDKGNLLVCDQNSVAIDVIPPPYTSVSKTFGSGYSIPFHITINKKNTQAYVGDYGTGEVYVLKYPSGQSVKTLGVSNGIAFAWAAVDSNNFVP